MLRLEKVHTKYGHIEALKGINLHIKEGEIVTIIGANGAGKTTTLNTISGILKPSAGKIKFLNEDITNLTADKIVAKGIVQVPEGRQIFPNLTVYENLLMGAYLRKDKVEIENDLEKVYELFPRLKERRDQLGGTLSGGEQQMLAIGRALMSKPVLLLLDEPSLGLAPIIVENIFEIIKEINSQGTTILLVEQNAHLALSIADRGYVMETGNIIMEDDAKALLDNEDVKKAYLGM
ncbi:branched-chain amino acid ABC transporter, ATP-binding protein [Deferribacter desulfuricans SSM1]|uniref:Branched-chain amino acid ABC transporter, ATP-binding protein n=1 Tax=Deferribacter desulfuricans (strain DSM 14783 / JCM 11476 / NBRC 101012 / SSM1) TaxID=639282 RepID=D3PD63_DEFDS|nr:ABC transporter ATP-binding protein [Deferribacter desulfuricans]BAI80536.1 branched-chain amino acid ABC transporter, ATP-binding protein [Deferribacter desulfuricans SSM1]